MIKKAIIIWGVWATVSAPMALAASQSTSHGVTIHVPSFLSLTSSDSQVQLTFSDNQQGAETNTSTITYSVQSNSMNQADGATAVVAQLDSTLPDMDIKASAGTYTKQGGDTELVPSTSGFVNVQNSATPLFVKQNSSGGGHVLRGSFPVDYKAVARATLPSGDYSRQLSVTLTDV